MFRVPSLVVLLGVTLCSFLLQKAMAQQFDESGVVYEAARNKLGLIRYCRDNALLDPAIAARALTVVEIGLGKLAPSDSIDIARGDRAEQAGEDGFWETGRRRGLAGVARLFGTTPADLCQEWASETLRAQAPRRRRAPTIAVIEPIRPLPQAEPPSVETVASYKPASGPTESVKVPPDAPIPPLPERAHVLRIEADMAAVPRAVPAGGGRISRGTAISEHVNSRSAEPTSAIPNTMPVSARLAAEVGALPDDETVLEAFPPRERDNSPAPAAEKWPFRCLMPGCKWPGAPERRSWRY